MNKKLSIIALALLGITIGTQPCCTTVQHKATMNQINSNHRSVKRDLKEIVDSVYCIRTKAAYQNDDDKKNILKKKKTSHGTAFAYAFSKGHTYLITNVHTVDHPEKLRHYGVTPSKTGWVLGAKSYTKKGETTKIVDSIRDSNKSDDIELEEVAKNKTLDIAILRTKKKLKIAKQYFRGTNIIPEVGDDVYIIGYPRGFFPAVTKGTMSNTGHWFRGLQYRQVLDVTSTFGNSGSPYFIRRGSKLFWAGVQDAKMPYKGNTATLFSLGVPRQSYAEMLSRYTPDSRPHSIIRSAKDGGIDANTQIDANPKKPKS